MFFKDVPALSKNLAFLRDIHAIFCLARKMLIMTL